MAHEHGHISAKQLGWRLIASIAINVVIVVAQLVGGLMAGSLALVTDALHNVTDVLSLGLSYGALRIAQRPADARYTFAYQRAEVLAAVLNAATLVGVSVFVAIEAVDRLRHPSPVAGGIVIVFAAFGMVANGAAALPAPGPRQEPQPPQRGAAPGLRLGRVAGRPHRRRGHPRLQGRTGWTRSCRWRSRRG